MHGQTAEVINSQSTDGRRCGCFVAGRSEAYVRCDKSDCFRSANLIFHHGLVDVIHQIAEPLRVVGVAQELRDILLSCHGVQSFVDIFQFPGDPCPSVSASELGDGALTVPASSSSLPPRSHLQK